MKLTLNREVTIERWRVVGTLGLAQRRPEIIAILQLVTESATGFITGADVAAKLLGGRPASVGNRLLQVCQMMNLVTAAPSPADGWSLTEEGRRALQKGEVPTPERGEFEIWLLPDALNPETIIAIRRFDTKAQPKNGDGGVPPGVREIPDELAQCQGRLVRPPVRSRDEPSEVYVFGFESVGSFLGRERGNLQVDLDPRGGTASFEVPTEDQPATFSPAFKLPALEEALESLELPLSEMPLKVSFATISDGELRTGKRDLVIDATEVGSLEYFSSIKLEGIPLLPESQGSANDWATWRLMDAIRGYTWPEDFDRHVSQVRDWCGKEGWSFRAELPTQNELAKLSSHRSDLVRHLLSPLDWLESNPRNAPILILSGKAARETDRARILSESGTGVSAIYVLTGADSSFKWSPSATTNSARTLVRQVARPLDAWIRLGPDGQRGERWHAPAKPTPQKQKDNPPQPKRQPEGEWKETPAAELPRIMEDLKAGFWRRAVSELRDGGAWVPVRPARG